MRRTILNRVKNSVQAYLMAIREWDRHSKDDAASSSERRPAN